MWYSYVETNYSKLKIVQEILTNSIPLVNDSMYRKYYTQKINFTLLEINII